MIYDITLAQGVLQDFLKIVEVLQVMDPSIDKIYASNPPDTVVAQVTYVSTQVIWVISDVVQVALIGQVAQDHQWHMGYNDTTNRHNDYAALKYERKIGI